MSTQIGVVGGAFVALYAAHQLGDHWVQTSHQCLRKGLPGWTGRWNCAKHVTTYTLTGLIALAALAAVTGWRPHLWSLVTGLAVSAVTHYIADRRLPLRRLATLVGAGGYVAHTTVVRTPGGKGADEGPGTGLFHLDQSWHYGWLFVAALLIAI